MSSHIPVSLPPISQENNYSRLSSLSASMNFPGLWQQFGNYGLFQPNATMHPQFTGYFPSTYGRQSEMVNITFRFFFQSN